jgi:hypothetical protein
MTNICLCLATDMLLYIDIGELCIPACYWQHSKPEQVLFGSECMTVPQLESYALVTVRMSLK